MKKLIASVVLCATALTVSAEQSFLQLSLTPDIALQSRDTVIKGLSLSIWGENEQGGLAIGFVNGSTGDSSGLSWGLVNYAENYTGVHLGIVNVARENFTGLQWGTVNVAKDYTGLQAGFVNYTESLNGVQLGFVNIVMDNPWFEEFPEKLAKGFPFVNWSF
jgi:hypothetical protein